MFFYLYSLQKKNYFYSLNHNGGHVFNDNGPFNLISKFHFDNIKSGRAKLIINYPFEGDLGENTWYEKPDDLGWLENWIRINDIDGKNVYLIHGNLRIKEVIKEQNLSFHGIPYVYFDQINLYELPSVQEYHPRDNKTSSLVMPGDLINIEFILPTNY